MLQRYRADISDPADPNGAIAHYARWIGGLSLAKITNCRVYRDIYPPRTVYVTGEPLTWTSQPAACTFRGQTIRGYLTCRDGAWLFHPYKRRSTRLSVTITYDTVSEASVVDGDHSDNGFIDPHGERRSFSNGRKRDIARNISQARRGRFEWSLLDALDFLRKQDGDREPWEAQTDGTRMSVRVFGEYNESDSAELQATYTLHLKGERVSAGTWARISRLLETKGARFY